jgi:predicted nucleotidyltransferase
MEIEELKKEVRRIVTKEFTDTEYKAFFFGSRILGTATATSDLDVGILGPMPAPKEKIASLKARFDALATLYRVDVVDFWNTSDDFKKVAMASVEPIN